MLHISLNAVTAVGAGDVMYMGDPRSTFGIQVTHTGAPTAVVVNLEGSLDGTSYFTLTTWDEATVNSGAIVFTADKPVGFARANLTTLTGGTTPTVTATISAK